MTKFDLGQMLKRRRVTVSRWISDTGISNHEQFEHWKVLNEHMYTYSETFNKEVADCMPGSGYIYAPYIPLITTPTFTTEEAVEDLLQTAVDVPSDQTVDVISDATEATPEEPRKNRKSKDKKPVQSDENNE